MTRQHLIVDGAKYRTLTPKSQPFHHMEARRFGCDVSEEVAQVLAGACASLVRWHCPKCGAVAAEAGGAAGGGPAVATAYERGPEPLVRMGGASLLDLQGPEKIPDVDIALMWLLGDLPDPWPLRCPKCHLRSHVDPHAARAAVGSARSARKTIDLGAFRIP